MKIIEEISWLPKAFARVNKFSDVFIEPRFNLDSLSELEVTELRETQALEGDTVRILFKEDDFTYIMKVDGSTGWIKNHLLTPDSELLNFIQPLRQKKSVAEFFNDYKGVPYLWGGITKTGIDCSGLMQAYFFSVYGILLPRNSVEQRKLSLERPFSDVKENDLVFCRGKGRTTHHVGVYLDSKIWHSNTIEGVDCHSVEQFTDRFNIECVVTVSV